MTGHWLEEAVTECGLPSPSEFPRNLEAELLWVHTVTRVGIHGLTTDGVREWLVRHGLQHRVAARCRDLQGCMVARSGTAVLFHDTRDSPSDQRFTLAHEVAHFVLNHLVPRARALRHFGEDIRPVLDGQRAATPAEKLSAVLDEVPIGVHIRLMDRNPSGRRCTGRVAEAERRADRLAFELLAPAAVALPRVKGLSEEEGTDVLVRHFELPLAEARTYVRLLLPRERPRPFSILEFLGEAGR